MWKQIKRGRTVLQQRIQNEQNHRELKDHATVKTYKLFHIITSQGTCQGVMGAEMEETDRAWSLQLWKSAKFYGLSRYRCIRIINVYKKRQYRNRRQKWFGCDAYCISTSDAHLQKQLLNRVQNANFVIHTQVLILCSLLAIRSWEYYLTSLGLSILIYEV